MDYLSFLKREIELRQSYEEMEAYRTELIIFLVQNIRRCTTIEQLAKIKHAYQALQLTPPPEIPPVVEQFDNFGTLSDTPTFGH